MRENETLFARSVTHIGRSVRLQPDDWVAVLTHWGRPAFRPGRHGLPIVERAPLRMFFIA
jgi:hypothetical protein